MADIGGLEKSLPVPFLLEEPGRAVNILAGHRRFRDHQLITVQGEGCTWQGGLIQSQGKSGAGFADLDILGGVVPEEPDSGLTGLVIILLAQCPVHQHVVQDHRDLSAGCLDLPGRGQCQA